MNVEIRDVAAADLHAVLALNESEVPHVAKVDIDQMQWFKRNADYFRVASSDSGLLAFLIGLLPAGNYGSPNYRWFCERYTDFAYIDRIAVAAAARGAGLASQLYADFAATMPPTVTRLTCEVNIKPPNEGSMRFHERLGFQQVGTLRSPDGDKQVAMLLKAL